MNQKNLNYFICMIQKERLKLKGLKFNKLKNNYYFRKGDKVIFNDYFTESISGEVVHYMPENPLPKLRLLIKSSNDTENWVSPQYTKPLDHTNQDSRDRLYLLQDDPKKYLHDLMNVYIVCFPNYSIGQSKEHSMFGKNPRSSFIIEHIISIPEQGFIYLGLDSHNFTPICKIEFYDDNGKVYQTLWLKIQNLIYKELKNIKELDF